MKKKLLVLFITVFSLFLTGCWSYVGLDEMTIVTGVAIDKNEADDYLLTFEVIDLANSSKQTGINTKIINSTGKTLFDAIRNAKAKIAHKLYFSNAQIIIIGNQVAHNEGISSVIDFFVRDAEIRETAMIMISQEEDAASLLNTKGMINNNIVSYNILEILRDTEKINLYSTGVELYNAVNILKSEGQDLILPAFHIAKTNDEELVELNGLATFKADKLYGYLTLSETKYLLFATNKVEGGIFTFSSKQEDKDDAAIEIYKNKTNINYNYKDDKLKIIIDVNMSGFLGELKSQNDHFDNNEIKELEKIVADKLKLKIADTIRSIREKDNQDILGFGNMIYHKNPKLWKKLKEDWNQTFKAVDVEINCKVNIKNTAFLRQ